MWRYRLLGIAPAARAAVVESMEDGVVVLDPEGCVVDVNPAAEEILGTSAGRLIGRPVVEVLSGTGGLGELLEKHDEGQGEMALGEGRERRVFDVRVSQLAGERRGCGGQFVVMRDISERKQAEETLQEAKETAEAANEAKSEFMSVASHEMRTPITCIKGYTDLLGKSMKKSGEDRYVEFLDIIRSNADRLTNLVCDLSDMARIESGRLRLELGNVRIEDVVEEALTEMRPRAIDKDQVLTVDLAENLPTVWGDHDSLVRVTANLLSNAHKFTPAGGRITVLAEALADEPEGVVVHVAVTDNGIGIKPEELERVFEKFYRSDDRKATDLPGSGLGLSIASNLVEMQGGQMWLESVFREGTTVHYIVPAARKP